MLIRTCSFTTALQLHSFKFTVVKKAVHSTTVIVLGARQVHERNRKLTSRHYTQLTWFLPIVVGKAYEHHVGKASKLQLKALSIGLSFIKN